MARFLGVSTAMYLRWERGQNRPHPLIQRTLALLAMFHKEQPSLFSKYILASARPMRGRPVGSRNVPEWMRPKLKSRSTGRPRGRPRKIGSERAARHNCPGIGYGRDLIPCGKVITGGMRVCPSCRENDRVNALHARTMAQNHAPAVTSSPQAAPDAAPPGARCAVPDCGKPALPDHRICADCRAAVYAGRESED